MKITPKIRTREEIDILVSGVQGTWVRQRNARKKMIEWSNELVQKEVDAKKTIIRKLKASGTRESGLRDQYAAVSRLEMRLL